MINSLPAAGTALWLGILTSISPCPLATNITALAFIARRMDRQREVWLSGLLYTAGRIVSYALLANILIAGLQSIPGLSFGLQKYMNMALGPLLVAIGCFLLGWISLPGIDLGLAQRWHGLAERGGLAGAGFLGLLFALTFCPVSAALYFGALIPLSIKHMSRFLLPALFGIGTGIPVLFAAAFTANGAKSISQFFNGAARLNQWGELITGTVFILIGAYYLWFYFLTPVLWLWDKAS